MYFVSFGVVDSVWVCTGSMYRIKATGFGFGFGFGLLLGTTLSFSTETGS